MRQSILGYVCDVELVSWDAAGEARFWSRFGSPNRSPNAARDFVGATAPFEPGQYATLGLVSPDGPKLRR